MVSDAPQAVHADALELALLALQAPVVADAGPGDQAHHRRTDHAQAGNDGGQGGVVEEHGREEDGAGDQLYGDSDELGGRHHADLVDQLDAGGQIAGEALAEEAHLKAQQAPDEAVGVVHRQPDRQQPETALPEPGEQVHQSARSRQPGDYGRGPASFLSAQHLVHEEAQQQGQGEEGYRQQQPAAQREEQGPGDLPQPRPETGQHAGPGAAPAEARAAPEAQDDAGEPLIELLAVDQAVAVGRVVHQVARPAEALQHEEVVELPEDDERPLYVPQLLGLLAPSLGLEPVLPGGAADVGGVAAVAVDCAGLA